jgi:competence protein ComEC
LFGWLVATGWRRLPALALRYPAQRAGLIAAALGAAGYALLAGFGVPAQRTLYMLLVAVLAMLSGRLIVPSQILAGALLVVLLVDPWAVLAPGFWLSFGAVAALLYIGSSVVGEGRGWRDRVRGWGQVQWAATLASIPVLMAVFQQFSLVSPLANALAVPVISFVITPLALLAALLPWAPILWLAHGLLDILMVFLIWCADWPLWQAPAPPFWTLPIAGLGVALCLLPRGVPGRWLGLLLLLPAAFWPSEPIPEGEARIDVLDVGQGQAVVIRTRAHVLIYDPGPKYSVDADAGQRVVLPYLRWLGVNAVDTLIVTHGDADHAGGLASLQAGVPVRKLISSMPELAGELCQNGQGWRWDGVDFSILHPDGEAYRGSEKRKKRNSLSCVLKVSAGERAMLLTADIEAGDEFAMLRRNGEALPADILLVPHHGARGSSTQAFVDAVAAEQVIFSVGYRNRFGHPKPETVDRYQSTAARLWRTDLHGALRVRLSPEHAVVASWRQQHARYWHGR